MTAQNNPQKFNLSKIILTASDIRDIRIQLLEAAWLSNPEAELPWSPRVISKWLQSLAEKSQIK